MGGFFTRGVDVVLLLVVWDASRLNGLGVAIYELAGRQGDPLPSTNNGCRGRRRCRRHRMGHPPREALKGRMAGEECLGLYSRPVNFNASCQWAFRVEGRARGMNYVITVRRSVINGRWQDDSRGGLSTPCQAAGNRKQGAVQRAIVRRLRQVGPTNDWQCERQVMLYRMGTAWVEVGAGDALVVCY